MLCGTGTKLCADSAPQTSAPGHSTWRSRIGPPRPCGKTVTVSSVAGAEPEDPGGLSPPSSSLPQPARRRRPARTIARRSMHPFYVKGCMSSQTVLLGGERGRLWLERQVEHLSDRHDRMERHRLADVLGHVVEGAAVALG